jgi:HNH endonuclease
MSGKGLVMDRESTARAHWSNIEEVFHRDARGIFDGKGNFREFKLRHVVLIRDRLTCQRCGRMWPEVELSVDHIHEVRNGGQIKDLSNLWTLCSSCHVWKTMVYDDYMWRTVPDSPYLQSKPLRKRRWEAARLAAAPEWPT